LLLPDFPGEYSEMDAVVYEHVNQCERGISSTSQYGTIATT